MLVEAASQHGGSGHKELTLAEVDHEAGVRQQSEHLDGVTPNLRPFLAVGGDIIKIPHC